MLPTSIEMLKSLKSKFRKHSTLQSAYNNNKCIYDSPSLNALSLSHTAELGDYDPEEHVDGYASAFKLYKRPSPGYEQKVEEIHRGLK